MPFMIVIDGPNFINQLHRLGRDKEYIMKTLSFPFFHGVIQQKLAENGLYSHPFLHTEFICSNLTKIGQFKGEEREKLLAKMRRQTGVSVRIVNLSRRKEDRGEKGVDMTVFSTMIERGGILTHVVLLGGDKDYVPALNALTKRNIHTVVVGIDDGKSEELINECYLFLNLEEVLHEMEKLVKKGDMKKILELQKTDGGPAQQN